MLCINALNKPKLFKANHIVGALVLGANALSAWL